MDKAKQYKTHLKNLAKAVDVYIAAMDKIMKLPESHARGQQIARAINFLDIEKDKARRFGLEEKPKKVIK